MSRFRGSSVAMRIYMSMSRVLWWVTSAAQKILGTYQVQWQGEDIDLAPGWPRMPMHEAVKQYCGWRCAYTCRCPGYCGG